MGKKAPKAIREDLLEAIVDYKDENGKTWEQKVREGLPRLEFYRLLKEVLFANLFDVRASSSNQAIAGILTVLDAGERALPEDDLNDSAGVKQAQDQITKLKSIYGRSGTGS